MTKNKSYTVKEWFANKIANEVACNISMCDVFAILKESDKAVYAILNLGAMKRKTTWVPKSVLIEREVGEQEDGSFAYETILEPDYEKAVAMFRADWAQYM